MFSSPFGHKIEREEVSQVYPQGDLPYLDLLLSRCSDLGQVRSEIYKYHEQNGNFDSAVKAEKRLREGVAYAKSMFPEIKNYLREQLSSLGYRLKDGADVKDPEIIPLLLPSTVVEGVEKIDGESRKYKGFSGAAAAVTPVYVQRRRTEKGYLMMANLPLADLPVEQVKTIGLHELIHVYFSELGIPEQEQKKLEPYIDQWMIDFYESKGLHDMAGNIRKHSGYLNKEKKQEARPWYVV